MAAVDIFASPQNLYRIDQTGEPKSMPPPVQVELLHIDLVIDAVIAASAVGATYLFLSAVALA
jgi:hypothetical protein